jgi:hypothetical protein
LFRKDYIQVRYELTFKINDIKYIAMGKSKNDNIIMNGLYFSNLLSLTGIKDLRPLLKALCSP